MKTNKIQVKAKERTIKKKQFYLRCFKCGKEITGNNFSNTLRNLNTHIESKHPKEKKHG